MSTKSNGDNSLSINSVFYWPMSKSYANFANIDLPSSFFFNALFTNFGA